MRFLNLPSLFFVFATFASWACGQNLFNGPWPLRPSDTPAAAGEIWGELPNGLRYVVVPADAPGGAVSLRLLVGAGRAHEEKGKAGVAHAVAGMMALGTEHFTRDDIFGLKLSSGMNPSSSSNTEVELDYTLYRIDMEEPAKGSLAKAMGFLGDIAGAPRFEAGSFGEVQASLEKESSYGLERFESKRVRREFVLQGSSQYAGLNDSLINSQVGKLGLKDAEAFWSKWYRSNRMVLVVVGLEESADIEALVAKNFGDLKPSETLAPRRVSSGKFRDSGEIEMEVSKDVFARLSMTYVSRGADLFSPSREADYYAMDFLGRYAESLSQKSKRLGSGVMTVLGDALVMSVVSSGPVMTFQEQLVNTDKTMHLLAKFGIRGEDLEQAKSDYLDLRFTYDGVVGARPWPGMVADRLARCVVDRVPFRFGEGLSKYLERTIVALPVDKVGTLCAEVFAEKNLSCVVELPENFVLTAKSVSKRMKLMRKNYDFTWEKAGESKQQWNMGSGFAPSGMVAKTELLGFDETAVLQYEFDNNIRLNLVKTDVAPGRVRVQVSMGNGMMDLSSQNPAFASMVRTLLLKTKAGGGAQSPTLREMMESNGLENVEVGLTLDELYWTAQGRTEENVADFLSTLVFWMVRGDLDEENFDTELEELTKMTEQGFDGSSIVKLDDALYGSDARLKKFFKKDDLEGLDFEGMNQWLAKTRESSYIELTVVGDIVPRTVLRDVRKTFGSAPKRTGKVLQPRHGKPVVWADAGISRSTFKSKTESGFVTLIFPQVEEKSCEADMRSNVFRSLLQEHLARVLAEAPGFRLNMEVSVSGEQMVPLSNALKVQVRCSKEEAARAEKLLLEGVESFAAFLTPEAVLAAERGSWLELKRIARSPNLLAAVLDQSQAKPSRLRCVMDQLEKGVSAEFDLYQSVAARQFSSENMRGVVLLPE